MFCCFRITKFTKSSTTTNTYSMEMTAARDGRELYCVITDEYGNQVTSNTAYMKIQHVYRKPIVQKGALIGTIQQANKADNIGIYASEGHYLDCVGEGCDADKLVAHSYSKQTRLVKNGNAFSDSCSDGTYRVYGQEGAFLALCRAEDGVMSTIKSFFAV